MSLVHVNGSPFPMTQMMCCMEALLVVPRAYELNTGPQMECMPVGCGACSQGSKLILSRGQLGRCKRDAGLLQRGGLQWLDENRAGVTSQATYDVKQYLHKSSLTRSQEALASHLSSQVLQDRLFLNTFVVHC